ncbi:hypothetical protein GGF46_003454 [Coemansia sp. RSA 552]|nr:hypothetical protein GGF46_003454 [Coemansia sp. RSA 552]
MAVDKQMTVASWEEPGKIALVEKPVPDIQPGEVLIRVAASGICGTDLHICLGETPHAKSKVTVGHEFSGWVEVIHPETKTTAVVGDLVAVDPNVPCNSCTFCRNAKYHLCYNLRCIGVSCNGGMSRHVAVPATAIFAANGIPPVVASLAEPLSCVVHAVDMGGGVNSGDRVLIIGAGPIGLMVCALCSTGGANVTVAELNQMRRTKALEFGASTVTDTVDIGGLPTEGFGYDRVYECVGRPETMEAALGYAKAGGTIVWVGVAKPGVTVPVSPFDVYRRELKIVSTYTNGFGMERAVKILSDGKVPWGNLISHTFTLEEFDQAWEVFTKNTGIKVCVKPNPA